MRDLDVEELAWSSEDDSGRWNGRVDRRKRRLRHGPMTRAASRHQSVQNIYAPVKPVLRFDRTDVISGDGVFVRECCTPKPSHRSSKWGHVMTCSGHGVEADQVDSPTGLVRSYEGKKSLVLIGCLDELYLHIPTPTNENLERLGQGFRQRCSIKQLPNEITLRIFRYLPSKSLAACAQVCCGWRTLAYDPTVWLSVELTHMRVVPLSLIQVFMSRRVQRIYLANAAIVDTHSSDSTYYAIPGVQEYSSGERCNQNLKLLSFKSCTVLPQVLVHLRHHTSSLQQLVVSSGSVVDSELAALIQQATNLRSIDLSLTIGAQDNTLSALADGCAKLEQANFSWLRYGGELANRFAKNHKHLTALNVSGYNGELQNSFLEAVASSCKTLNHLDIRHSFVSLIQVLPGMGLYSLYIQNAFPRDNAKIVCDNYEITDLGVRTLIEHCPCLETLCMSRCRSVPFEGVLQAALLPSLQALNIFGFAPNLLDELVAIRPSLRINADVSMTDRWPKLCL